MHGRHFKIKSGVILSRWLPLKVSFRDHVTIDVGPTEEILAVSREAGHFLSHHWLQALITRGMLSLRVNMLLRDAHLRSILFLDVKRALGLVLRHLRLDIMLLLLHVEHLLLEVIGLLSLEGLALND